MADLKKRVSARLQVIVHLVVDGGAGREEDGDADDDDDRGEGAGEPDGEAEARAIKHAG